MSIQPVERKAVEHLINSTPVLERRKKRKKKKKKAVKERERERKSLFSSTVEHTQ